MSRTTSQNKQAKINFLLTTIILSTVLIISAMGCRSLAGENVITLKLYSNDKVLLQGREVHVKKLAKALKAAKAPSNATIKINVPSDYQDHQISAIISSLSKSGYVKVFFKKPVTKTVVITNRTEVIRNRAK